MRDTTGMGRRRTMTDLEVWLPAPGWEDHYDVSTHGRVRRSAPGAATHIGRIVQPYTAEGAVTVRLTGGGKRGTVRVAALVATAFHGPRSSTAQIPWHRDGDPRNNQADNVEWRGRAEVGKGGKRALDDAQAAEVLALKNKVPAWKIAADRGVTPLTIYYVWGGRGPYAAVKRAFDAKRHKAAERTNETSPPSNLADAVGALAGDTQRLRLLELLKEQPRTAAELAQLMGLGRLAVNKRVRKLPEGMVESRRDGRKFVYRLTKYGKAMVARARRKARPR